MQTDNPPRIQLNALTTAEDQQVAVDALRLTRRIVGMPALRRYQPQEFRPGPEARTDDELLAAAREIGTTIFHPVGTARMGPAGDIGAVTDAAQGARDAMVCRSSTPR